GLGCRSGPADPRKPGGAGASRPGSGALAGGTHPGGAGVGRVGAECRSRGGRGTALLPRAGGRENRPGPFRDPDQSDGNSFVGSVEWSRSMKDRLIVGAAIGDCVHVAGVVNFLNLAEELGYRTVCLGPAVSLDTLLANVEDLDPALVAVGYRLTPENCR